ncbi:efflux transporter outer membrane subunit [Scleromatobacter humisilvae]|uniref:Efflux transporter outer membrane subunit n=1 Tax=Scleromatobacter humisilvae TaxID=2897159 RepID=A0A9X1YJA1_9BURK|nr:efflux transporter outer membrane subunit [Scleromatobacter humisilvae]MCK9686445.1 efflux transporter outer membrane subunit [Scleromatobacter humisilvae]
MTMGPPFSRTPPPARASRAPARLAHASLALAALLALGACTALAPNQKFDAPTSAQFLEPPPGWMAAAPADTLTRGPWWTLFDDPVLTQLAPQVAVSNQNVAAAAAAVEESWATVREQRAAFFPTLSADVGVTRSGVGGRSSSSSASTSSGGSTGNRFSAGLSASWEPDLWGRIANTVSAAKASAQASEADLANATLSAQATFVTDYLSVREADAEIVTLKTTITGYQRALTITQNRYNAAIAPKSDVLQAQTTLANAQADLASLQQQRAQFFHAMAVLAGQPPATFTLPSGDWNSTTVPAIPVGLPSDLLQRRPDIASAERHVEAANANIGVARAAYFPSLTLSGSAGQGASRLGDLFNASSFAWSLGASLAETIFDGGARTARVEEAQAAWKQSVAQYRQTVLTAFSSVEDQLSAAASLEQQQALRKEASQAADQTEQIMQNQYRQGLVAYTDVVTAQASALSARRALMQVTLSRQTAALQMISALGGGWSTQELATR